MEAWELPISVNPLMGREDLVRSLDQIMEPLLGRFVRGNAGLHVGNSSALYEDSVAWMEGACRLLWGLAPLAAGGGLKDERGAAVDAARLLMEGLKNGTDPKGPFYWGVGGDRDQRFVEMAAIALSLLIAPAVFWDPLSQAERGRLAAWLFTINGVELPPTNWEFFRILVNVALRSLDRPYAREKLETSLAAVEALYREDGWYADETNFDLYNPFAFHFFGLVYAKLEGSRDPERAARFRDRAYLFARQFLPWFASNGDYVPFGRSLCYRFAAVSFFSACAFADEEVLPWGAMKGIVLRNLRRWFHRPIFDHEGILSIGFGYPNLIMAEQYNSPGSPYWSLKAYLVLTLPASHPFWAAEEEALPDLPRVSRNAPPNILACRAGSGGREHVYLLNAGQYPCWESVNAAAKYAKFAYSASFGFCVSHGSFDLPKTGCDSSLLFSEGDGYWRERRSSRDRYSCEEYVRSVWEPWPDVRVKTWLVPCGPWHVRVHEIDSSRELECVEGGFSLPLSQGKDGPSYPALSKPRRGALLASMPWAYGGIIDLGGTRGAELHRPEPNLNILHSRVLIPILRGSIGKGRSLLSCAVLAGISEAGDEGDPSASGPWTAPPALIREGDAGKVLITYDGLRLTLDPGF
jgi:hypothetical protein